MICYCYIIHYIEIFIYISNSFLHCFSTNSIKLRTVQERDRFRTGDPHLHHPRLDLITAARLLTEAGQDRLNHNNMFEWESFKYLLDIKKKPFHILH